MKKIKSKVNDIVTTLEKLTKGLEKIRQNPEGGTLILRDETGRETMRFTMPALKDREK